MHCPASCEGSRIPRRCAMASSKAAAGLGKEAIGALQELTNYNRFGRACAAFAALSMTGPMACSVLVDIAT